MVAKGVLEMHFVQDVSRPSSFYCFLYRSSDVRGSTLASLVDGVPREFPFDSLYLNQPRERK